MPWEDSKRKAHVGSGSAEQAENRRILEEHRGVCHVCGKPGADEVDHVLALSEGGANSPANKRPIHARPCHKTKTAAEAARARARRRGDR